MTTYKFVWREALEAERNHWKNLARLALRRGLGSKATDEHVERILNRLMMHDNVGATRDFEAVKAAP